jgi:predicted secreted Zn-dependent protease
MLERSFFFASILILLVACSTGLGYKSSPLPTETQIETISAAAGEEVSIIIDRLYYQIEGASSDDLRAQMDQLGRNDEDGLHWDGYTEWYITWAYPFSVTDGDCTLGPVEVIVDVTIVLPQWDAPADASPELVRKWENFIKTLELHEEGHKEIAIEAGHEICQLLNGFTSYSSCDELEQAADAAAQEILDRYLQREVVYDQETEHGITQGVRFP